RARRHRVLGGEAGRSGYGARYREALLATGPARARRARLSDPSVAGRAGEVLFLRGFQRRGGVRGAPADRALQDPDPGPSLAPARETRTGAAQVRLDPQFPVGPEIRAN